MRTSSATTVVAEFTPAGSFTESPNFFQFLFIRKKHRKFILNCRELFYLLYICLIRYLSFGYRFWYFDFLDLEDVCHFVSLLIFNFILDNPFKTTLFTYINFKGVYISLLVILLNIDQIWGNIYRYLYHRFPSPS